MEGATAARSPANGFETAIAVLDIGSDHMAIPCADEAPFRAVALVVNTGSLRCRRNDEV
jgi:hypothetical protein